MKVTEDGKVDTAKLRVIFFDPCGNPYMQMGDVVGKAFQGGKKLQ